MGTPNCKFCFSKLNEGNTICGFCKIPVDKNKKELTKEEKKICYYCRALHFVGFLSVIGGALGLAIMVFGILAYGATLRTLILFVFGIVLSGILFWFGLSIRKYKRWCYMGGIILYSFMIVASLLEFNLLRLLIQILLLSYIAAPTSKKILYREI